MAEALYRKYRPQTFQEMVGQDRIETTLLHAIEANKLSHAYLFCGPRGTGKTSTARLLAKALLCEQGPTTTPDPNCDSCKAIAEGTHPDVYELDAASRTGVENVREEIIGRVQFAPTQGRCKIYIIDEVHMLSIAAFNALLKTLEEPPDHVVFILCTTDPQKIPDTILSRCQRFDFKRISHEALVSRLAFVCQAEQVEYDEAALDLIAARSDGGMRNALTTLEQLIAFGQGKLDLASAQAALGEVDGGALADLVMHIGQRDAAAAFMWLAQFCETGADLARFVQDLAERMRDIYLVALTKSTDALELPQSIKDQVYRESQLFSIDRTGNVLAILADLSKELKSSPNTRLLIELALTRMVHPESDLSLSALAERVEALESQNIRLSMQLDALKNSGIELGASQAPVRSMGAEVLVSQQGASVPTSAPSNGGGASVGGAASVLPGCGSAPNGSISGGVPNNAPAQDLSQGLQESVVQPSQGVNTSSGQRGTLPNNVAPHAANSGAYSAPANEPVAVGKQVPSVQAAGSSPFVSVAGSGDLPPKLVAALANPAALQRMWQMVLAELKKTKPAHGVLFLNSRISFDKDSQTLHLAFPPENAFIYNTVQKPEVVDHLKECIKKSCGTDVAFVFDPLKSKTPGSGLGQAGAVGSAGMGVAQSSSGGFVPPQPQFMQAARSVQPPAQAQPQVGPGQVQAQTQTASVQPYAQAQPQPQPQMAPVPDRGSVSDPASAPVPAPDPAPSFEPSAQVAYPGEPAYPEPDEVPLDVYDAALPEELAQEDPYGAPLDKTLGSEVVPVGVPSSSVPSPASASAPVVSSVPSNTVAQGASSQAASFSDPLTGAEPQEAPAIQGGYLEPVEVKRGVKKKAPLPMSGEFKQDTSFLEHDQDEPSVTRPVQKSVNTEFPILTSPENAGEARSQGAQSTPAPAGVSGASLPADTAQTGFGGSPSAGPVGFTGAAAGASPSGEMAAANAVSSATIPPTNPDGSMPNHEDLNALLSASFGEGVKFTEI